MYNAIINRMAETFDKILKVDLTNDSFTIIKNDSEGPDENAEDYKYISEWLSLFAQSGSVYSEDVPIFKHYTSLAYMRSFFKRNENHWVKYRRRYGDVFCWSEMQMLTAEDYTDDNQQIYLFVRKMNESSEIDINHDYYKNEKQILVVEGDDEERERLSSIFRESYTVLEASDYESTKRLLNENYENLLVVIGTLNAPKKEIVEAIRSIKRNSRFNSIPVIVSTEEYSPEFAIECLESGAFDFIVKPYNKSMILNKVNGIAKLRYSISMLNTVKTDPLTGLYSKPFFFKRVEEILNANPDKKYRMVCTDIESFRLINENFGEEAGDSVLVYIAERIGDILPNILVGGRISGDIFAFFREDIPFEYDHAVWKAFRKSAPVKNLVVKYGISSVDRRLSVQAMCDHAQEAVKSIKNVYGKPFAEYTQELEEKKLRERNILDEMENALLEQSFSVFYQPKYDVADGSIKGAEALVRWEHSELGFLSPIEFIPLFEKNGFITKLDEYVLERACRDIAYWREQGYRLVPISVNLSRRDFESDDLVDVICQITEKYHVPKELIHLELTESAFTDNMQRVSSMISELRQRGFAIELDDFGSGYSSLTTLNELELDVLKIDRSILNKSTADSDNRVLEFCVQIARMLNLEIVVEGVETKEQVELLDSMGVDLAQGYYFAKPLPVNEFEQRIM